MGSPDVSGQPLLVEPAQMFTQVHPVILLALRM